MELVLSNSVDPFWDRNVAVQSDITPIVRKQRGIVSKRLSGEVGSKQSGEVSSFWR